MALFPRGLGLGGSEPQADAIREAEHTATAAAAAAKGGAPGAASLGEKFQSFGRGGFRDAIRGPLNEEFSFQQKHWEKNHVSNENKTSCLGYIRDYTTQILWGL